MNNKHFHLFQQLRRRLAGCLLFLLYACHSSPEKTAEVQPAALPHTINTDSATALLNQAIPQIRSGDMITRTGNDFTSECLRQFCQTDKTYSHCGIASVENGGVYIYHALGGEFNPDQRLLRESLAAFVTPAANRGFGVFRFDIDSTQANLLLLAVHAAHKSGITFDMKFDLATDDKMYCSEFTAKMYRMAYRNDTMFATTHTPALDYLAPDNLFTHSSCREVYRATY